MDSTLSQGVQALAYLYCGIVVGIVSGLTGLLRNRCAARWSRDACDVFTVLCSTAAFAAGLYITDGGRLRLFAFAMTSLGILLERGTLHASLLAFRSKRIHKLSMEFVN